jgi:endonuclease-3
MNASSRPLTKSESCITSSPADGEQDDAKPIRYIIQNLERVYGVPENSRSADPLDMLIGVILSQATSDSNSRRTFAALKKRFPTWAQALNARTSTIATTIREGGLANQKAEVIKNLLKQIKAEHGALELDFLHELSVDDARGYLVRFRGIGPKTVACTLLFACRKEIFPLDTHIFRVLRRVGLIPARCTDAQAHRVMDAIVPSGKFYSLHVNVIRHGRAICKPREPLCKICPIVEYCDYGQEKGA